MQFPTKFMPRPQIIFEISQKLGYFYLKLAKINQTDTSIGIGQASSQGKLSPLAFNTRASFSHITIDNILVTLL